MPCLFLGFMMLMPRVLIVVLWLFTTWFAGIFTTALWPVLGFIFLPTSLLWYTAVQHWWSGQWTAAPIIGMVVAVLIDMSPAKGRRWKREA